MPFSDATELCFTRAVPSCRERRRCPLRPAQVLAAAWGRSSHANQVWALLGASPSANSAMALPESALGLVGDRRCLALPLEEAAVAEAGLVPPHGRSSSARLVSAAVATEGGSSRLGAVAGSELTCFWLSPLARFVCRCSLSSTVPAPCLRFLAGS